MRVELRCAVGGLTLALLALSQFALAQKRPAAGDLPPMPGDAPPIGSAPPPPASAAPSPGTPPPPPPGTAPAAPPGAYPAPPPGTAYPGYGYPATGYPPGGYPPGGYPPGGYPPYAYPPGYPPGYYPYAERAPATRAPRYSPDAAAENTPFLDVLIAGQTFSDRYGSPFNIGVQFGAFIDARFRIAARAVLFTDKLGDQQGYAYNYTDPSGYYSASESKSPSLLYGASAGIVAASTPSFAMSPSIVFLRSDVSDYGNFLGLGLPFDWVMHSGLRVGFELDFGRAFAGTYTETCASQSCTAGASRQQDRDPGTGFYIHFQIGWGFHPPTPLPQAPPP